MALQNKIFSSHGHIVFDNHLGLVVKMFKECDCHKLGKEENTKCSFYHPIVKIDVGEFEKHYGHPIPDHGADILNVGYWYRMGIGESLTYEEPAHDWREELLKMKQESSKS